MKTKLLILTLLSLLPFLIFSQDKKDKDFTKNINIATKKMYQGDYYGALKIYNTLFQQDSLDKQLNYNMGVCNYQVKNYDEAEKNFLKTNSSSGVELFRYKAEVAHHQMKFKKALNFYNAYKLISGKKELNNEEINILIEKTRYAELAIKDRRDVLITNLGSTINTEYHEYVPLISADESTLFFTSRRPGGVGNLRDPNNIPYEDIYVTNKVNNTWGKPQILREGLNTKTNDACVGIAPDGQTLFIFRTNEDLVSGDLYESKREIDDWANPTKLGSDINSEYIESSATISADGRTLYFSSNRPGGYGGKDIYRVLKLPNGKWSKAINMGATINTEADEDAPFINVDNKTLYFSSKGHQNMGGYDVFKTSKEKGKWSIPENLRYPINTVNDDIFFILSANGRVGYYSSSKRDSYGKQDIYKIVLKDQENKKYVIKANVGQKKGRDPLSARITLIENESKKVEGIYKSNSNNGNFILIVDADKTYNIIIESENYHPYISNLDFDINDDKPIVFKLERKKRENEE